MDYSSIGVPSPPYIFNGLRTSLVPHRLELIGFSLIILPLFIQTCFITTFLLNYKSNMYIFLNIQAVQKCKKCKPSHIFLSRFIQKGQRLERADQTNLTLLWGMRHQRQFCFHVLTKLWSVMLSGFLFWNDTLLFIVLLSQLILSSIKIRQAEEYTLGYPSP